MMKEKVVKKMAENVRGEMIVKNVYASVERALFCVAEIRGVSSIFDKKDMVEIHKECDYLRDMAYELMLSAKAYDAKKDADNFEDMCNYIDGFCRGLDTMEVYVNVGLNDVVTDVVLNLEIVKHEAMLIIGYRRIKDLVEMTKAEIDNIKTK